MKSGFYWHVHHDTLLEWCYDYEQRKQYIETQKPQNERALRLSLFRPVRGKLPNELVATWTDGHATWVEWDSAVLACADQLTALHKVECPDCPWDGQTIFPPAATTTAGNLSP